MKPISMTLAALALSLGACQHVENHQNVREARQAIVTPIETRLALDPKSSVRDQVDAFVLRHNLTRRDDVSIYLPLDQERLGRKMLRHLEKNGLSANLIAHDRDGLEIALTRYHIRVPNCPDWSDHPGRDYTNQVSANFGCASASNLALMIADPKDLLVGRDLSPADGAYLSTTIQGYRTPRSTSSSSESTGE